MRVYAGSTGGVKNLNDFFKRFHEVDFSIVVHDAVPLWIDRPLDLLVKISHSNMTFVDDVRGLRKAKSQAE